MNKEQKTAVVEEVAGQIQESEAVFAVDYRGISVPQVAELRTQLGQAGARFRVVKNTLTIRAAEEAGASDLKELLEGPTAFTFVAAEGGDAALAAKVLSQFRRQHEVLAFKGGRLGGETVSVDQIQALANLPAREILHGQLVGMVASPLTGLVRGLNQLIAGLASQLQQMVDQGLVTGAPPSVDEPAAAEPAAAEEARTEAPEPDETPVEAEESDGEAAEVPETGDEGNVPEGTETSEISDAPSEGDDESDAPSEGEEKES